MKKSASIQVALNMTLLTACFEGAIHRIAHVRGDHSPRQNIDTASLQAVIRHQTLPPCLPRDDGSNGSLVSSIRSRRRLTNRLIRSV